VGIEEIRKEIKKFQEFNDNENTITNGTQQKAGLKGKVIAMSVHTKNIDRSQINDLMLHLKLL
jgi:hypothetical protein